MKEINIIYESMSDDERRKIFQNSSKLEDNIKLELDTFQRVAGWCEAIG